MNGFMSLLISFTQHWLGFGLAMAIEATFSAALLACVVLAINLAFRRWMTAGQVCLLWSIVLLRLMLPIAPSSVVSLQNLLYMQRELTEAEVDRMYESNENSAVSSSQASPSSAVEPGPVNPDNASADSEEIDPNFDWTPILLSLCWVWFLAGGGLLVGTIFAHRRFCQRVRAVPDCLDPRIGRLWQESCTQVRMRSSGVKLLDAVEQPALLGFLRPTLLLPVDAGSWNDDQLRMVMLHELAHGKRWDVAMNWGLLVIAAIHWWNPLYWLAASRVRSLREQACDAFALAQLEGATRLGYGELLLDLAARPQAASAWKVMLPVSIVGFFSSYWRKRAIGRRIKALRFSAGSGRLIWLAGAALIACVAATGLTDARNPYERLDPDWSWVGANYDQWSVEIENSQDASPTVTRVYSVEKVLPRIARSGKPDDHALNELRLQLIFLLNAATGRGASPSSEWAQKQFSLVGSTLTLNATPRIHAEMAKNLAAWEQSGWGQTSLETKFICYEYDLSGKLGFSWQSLMTVPSESRENGRLESGLAFAQARTSMEDYLPVGLAKLNDAQVAALMNRVEGDARTWVMQAPKISAFNGQEVTCRGYKRQKFSVGAQAEGREKKPLPTHTEIDEGFRLAFRAVHSADHRKVHLESRVDLNHIEEVRSISTQVGNEKVLLQIPRMSRRQVAVASDLDDGQALLIGCFPSRQQKTFLYVLLTPRVILDEEAEAR